MVYAGRHASEKSTKQSAHRPPAAAWPLVDLQAANQSRLISRAQMIQEM
jgi:hypothetical protein